MTTIPWETRHRLLAGACWKALDPVARDVLLWLGIEHQPLVYSAVEITVSGCVRRTGWSHDAVATALRVLEGAGLVCCYLHHDAGDNGGDWVVWVPTVTGEDVLVYGVSLPGKES